jgi:hypothetical protein
MLRLLIALAVAALLPVPGVAAIQPIMEENPQATTALVTGFIAK